MNNICLIRTTLLREISAFRNINLNELLHSLIFRVVQNVKYTGGCKI